MSPQHLLARFLAGLAMVWSAQGISAEPVEPLPFRVPAKMPDAAEMLSPSAVALEGWLGGRVQASASQRLLDIDVAPLLAGFQSRPGEHPWIGEHVGKWMHAATLAWANTGNARLRKKLDQVAADLIKTQEPDGYLGTYAPDKRFWVAQRRRLGRLVAQVQPDRPADVLPVHG